MTSEFLKVLYNRCMLFAIKRAGLSSYPHDLHRELLGTLHNCYLTFYFLHMYAVHLLTYVHLMQAANLQGKAGPSTFTQLSHSAK